MNTGHEVLPVPDETLVTRQKLTGAEANESLFSAIKASDPPLIDRPQVFAINTTCGKKSR